MSVRGSLVRVGVWVALALCFAAGVFYYRGHVSGIEFITCYVIEWTLSLDNLFVFMMIFRTFGVHHNYQVRTLRWGIMGAVVLRFVFIVLGVALVRRFEFILLLFGALLIYSGYRMAFHDMSESDFKDIAPVRWGRRFLPLSSEFAGHGFFVKQDGRMLMTPMVLVLIAIASCDLIFAVDSIPAAFAITRQSWIILSANFFAVMGLRWLYFLLVHANNRFWLLKYGISILLGFVGLKMILADWVPIGGVTSLMVVLGVIGASVLGSLLFTPPASEAS